ncbi:MAG: bifunctional lysine ketoglutarate reductase /saccharopine dehydrogenase family protein [Proteobacteria bacterium]|nr:bifunctional lysine ketoglutarate reductase /saccharopine dehydrogenase family protein [Pseudomonadota bacterium]
MAKGLARRRERIGGIRREDKNRWERRVPLTPEDVGELIARHGLGFHVQPSPIRVFPDERYAAAGATLREDLSDCDLILGVKEVPTALLLPRKGYIFFSHTIKCQPYNMPMLRRLLDLGGTLFDYELIADERGRRLVFFGNFAGLAGMIVTLHALGERLQIEGIPSPFLGVRMAHQYPDLPTAKRDIAEIGATIRREGLDPRLSPLVFGVTGYGHVSTGAQEILDLLPVQTITPEELPGLRSRADLSRRRVYKVVFKEEHLVRPLDPRGRFELQDYYDHPEKYASIFESYTPHLNVLINGIYWAEKYPRLITKAHAAGLFAGDAQPNLRVIGDISCDIEGSIEPTLKATDPANPCYVYDTRTGEAREGYAGHGPVIMAVDNLPCELPVESSTFFGHALRGFVAEFAGMDLRTPLAGLALSETLKRAMIAERGTLLPRFGYIEPHLPPTGA